MYEKLNGRAEFESANQPESSPMRKRLKLLNAAKVPSSIQVGIPDHKRPNCVYFVEDSISGIAIVDDEIFVISEPNFQSLVKVYDANLIKTAVTYNISVPNMRKPRGLAGCSYNKALYISDSFLGCIHRYDLTSKSSKLWNMKRNHVPRTVSLTAEHTLLVTLRTRGDGESGIVEYTSEGEPLHEIRLNSKSLKWVWQTVQLSDNRFIICQGWANSFFNRVCAINTEGQITKTYGTGVENGEDRLSHPYSIAIDHSRKRIYVADTGNDRVLCLDTDLCYQFSVHTPGNHKKPNHLNFDPSSDRLVMSGERDSNITTSTHGPIGIGVLCSCGYPIGH